MKMYSEQPAKNWLEGFPIGNGRLGGMILGDPNKEIIYLNEDTLWSGYPINKYKGFTRKTFEKAKCEVLNGEYSKATRILEDELMEAEDAQMYLPFGEIEIERMDRIEPREYTRCLDLSEAVIKTNYCREGNAYSHIAFASNPLNGIVYMMESEEPFDIKLQGQGDFISRIVYKDDEIQLYGECPGRFPYTVGQRGTPEAKHVFSSIPKERGMQFEGRIRIISTGGYTNVLDDGIELLQIKRLELIIMIRTSYNGFLNHPFTNGCDYKKLLEQDLERRDDFDCMLQEHIKDYQKYYNRMSLYLGNNSNEPVNIQKIWEEAEDLPNISLQLLLFHYGRYLLISSSREGTQAANLQGIWNSEVVPPWFCEYTTNINFEMNYWMVGPCNLGELFEPFVQLCLDLLVTGKKCAKEFFGCRGACSFHNVDIWKKATPANGKAMWSFWPFGLAWMCRNLADQYSYTGDKKYLKKILPVLEESSLFCLDMLETTSEGYAVVPATSPENEFIVNGEKLSVAQFTENTNAIVRWVFRDYLNACKELGIRGEVYNEVKRILPDIVPIRLGSIGQILEWNKEFTESERHHRHLSHLYELHPGNGITRQSPDTYNAARKSLEIRGDDSSGWSLVWKICMWARLEDGEWTDKLLRKLFRLVSPDGDSVHEKGGLYPNLLCAPPFQIDGNFGYVAAVSEMLLQSHSHELVLLPAIPDYWTNGEVTGIMARGGISVGIKWNRNEVQYTLKATRDIDVNVRVKSGKGKLIKLYKGCVYSGKYKKRIENG